MVILSEFTQESSPTYDYRYDVFLSFRGRDTRLSFTDHLHKALVDANIYTFLDDEEIQTEEDLKPELESAIKASRASIIVLSNNYASSTWCLDELVLILDRHRTSGHIVIPIFYHVEPTDVRKQQNSFGDAMAKHKQRMEAETNAEKRSQLAQKMETWKKALTGVASLTGMVANGRREIEFIQKIVMVIRRRLGIPLTSTLPLLIGMQHSIKFITSWLKDGSSHTADILTILGMGGIGKTSLAKYVYGLHCRVFDRSGFIEDISRRCAEQFNGLLDLQKQLWGDISKSSPVQGHDVFVYTSKIENAIAGKKVFLVLDGIDHPDQLDKLLGNKGLHPGSKIIITTRVASLTEKSGLFNPIVQPKHTKHLLRGLHEFDSLRLLSFHAFKFNGSKEGYEEVSKKLVDYCEGHPLALEVLGQSLSNCDVAEWEDYIEGLKKETHFRITKALQMSFDSLPSTNNKELFKHIACFFVGKDREFTETILRACDIHTVYGIRNLIDRCLLRIGPENELMMHQLLQEMGRDVVRQESPDKPWKRSRLWCHEESFKVLKQKKGKGNLLGLTLDMRMLEKKFRGSFVLETDALSKMDNLMLLQLNYVQLDHDGSYKDFPQELRWLCMHGFPLKCIPSDLPMKNLVVLDMSCSKIVSFGNSYSYPQRPRKRQKLLESCSKDKRLLGSLKILNLSFCYELRSVGGFFELPSLERLILANCKSLNEICESIEQCDELVFIDLSYCNEVKMLLRTIDKLKKVKKLSLEGCNLGENASSSAIAEAIPRPLKSFAISFPSSLVILSLKDNNLSNESFPMDFSGLSMLKELFLDCNPIVSLPNCVRSLPRLEILSMSDCQMLETIKCLPRTLRMSVIYKEMSPLSIVPPIVSLPRSSIEIQGIVKAQPIEDVEKKGITKFGLA